MTRIALVIFGIFATLFLVGCRDESRSSYLELSGRVIIFNPRVATATYVVTLNVLKDVPAGTIAKIAFQDPAGGADLVLQQNLKPGQNKINFESEPLFCVKADRRYNFVVTLVSGNGEVLQTIESSILSTLDQSVLPEAPLVEGPGYDPNPALKDGGTTKALREKVMACPAKGASVILP